MAFDGTWKVDRSENYDKFMEKMGINIMKRRLAARDNLELTITQEGNKFTVKESSTFRTTETVFELGVTFNYRLADGTELSGSWSPKGNKLVGKFKQVDNGNKLTAVQEITDGEMVLDYLEDYQVEKTLWNKGPKAAAILVNLKNMDSLERDVRVTSGPATEYFFWQNLKTQLSARALEADWAGPLIFFRAEPALPAGCHGDSGPPGCACALGGGGAQGPFPGRE
ncbi:PREDICTED: fatty acid-binding protein, intestinal [Ceratotherium simum simum]|uniref:Fatty acid-binding protein, intestinal n=1 Tax=Ceratotherium simum simum TaxID=73337 RepID=A0ABM1CK95_CERSS|nr:PREDICTED: fatty acid-binding protein, intestinal [Ceratotherium simum simum]